MAGVSMATSAGGSILGAFGAKQGGAAQQAMYNYQAGIAQLNKQVATQNAQWAIESGDVSAEESGLKSAQEIGATKAAQGASGLDVNTGTTGAVRDMQTKVAAYDQNIIRWNAAKTAYGFESKAATDTAQTQIDIAAGKQAVVAGDIGAATSILGGVSSVSSKWLQGQSAGIFGGKGQIGTFDPNNWGAAPTWA